MRSAGSYIRLLVVLFSALPLAAADVPISQIVVEIDPATELVGTRPGWSGLSATQCGAALVKPKPLTTQKFTNEEVIALAAKAGRTMPVAGKPGTVAAVLAKVDGVPTPVSVTTYRQQLNGIESFLNQFGASLREESEDLGVIARLRPTDPSCNTFREPTLKPNPLVWEVQAASRPGIDWRRHNPLARRVLDRGRVWQAIAGNPPRGSVRPRRDISLWFGSRQPIWLEASRVRGLRSSRANSNRASIPEPDLDLGEDLIVSTELSPERMRFDAPGGVSIDLQTKPSSGCGSPAIECWKGESACPDVSSNAIDNPAPPDVDTFKGEKTSCLREGVFLLNVKPWNSCITKNGGFGGWFGAESCISIRSENAGKDGNFSLHSRLEMDSGMTIFKVPITLVEMQAAAHFTTAGGTSTEQPAPKGLLPELGVGTTCCDPIQGPSATIPIWGPLTLVISSTLIIDIDAGNLVANASAPAAGCPDGPQKALAIEGKAKAAAAVELEAYLSAYAANAGLQGVLTFSRDVLEGKIDTTLDLGNNRLLVTPKVKYSAVRLEGQVFAFVEVDLFVTSKRWKIEIANFPGFTAERDLGGETFEVAAVVKPELACP